MKCWRLSSLTMVALIGLLPSASWACAVCWGGDAALAQGLNVSIAFMMAMPFLISGSIIGVLYIAQKRVRGQRWPYVSIKDLIGWMQKEGIK